MLFKGIRRDGIQMLQAVGVAGMLSSRLLESLRQKNESLKKEEKRSRNENASRVLGRLSGERTAGLKT